MGQPNGKLGESPGALKASKGREWGEIESKPHDGQIYDSFAQFPRRCMEKVPVCRIAQPDRYCISYRPRLITP
jgi:hypothetical protein